MIVILKTGASADTLARIQKEIETLGLIAHVSVGKERTVVGAVGSNALQHRDRLLLLDGVEDVIAIQKPYKFVSREFKSDDSQVSVDGVVFGGRKVQIIAGPCTVESESGLMDAAEAVKRAGALLLRGGAFKPRTSPYAFQGLGEEGLRYLKKAKQATGLKIVSELLDPRDAPLFHDTVDMIQIGARNMQNFRLLTEVGQMRKPVLLKRGMSATIKEWLMSAEYIASQGNHSIVLCERGIRTFETETRATLDLSAIPVLRHMTHLPIVVDPSHAVGKWDYVESMCRAAVAAGADGLLVEVHPEPQQAMCDGPQALRLDRLQALMNSLKTIAGAVGREF